MVDAAAVSVYQNGVKPLNNNDTKLICNAVHKLAAGLTGCVAAKAKDESCESAAIGAIIGEMWGDWHTDNPNTLTQDEKDKLINQAKLIAGITAAYAGEGVNVAADMAAEAVRWNASNQGGGILGLSIDDEFRQDMKKYAGKDLSDLSKMSDYRPSD